MTEPHLSAERTPEQNAALDAIRAYGDARADVAYGRATRKAIDHAWSVMLGALAILPLAHPSDAAGEGRSFSSVIGCRDLWGRVPDDEVGHVLRVGHGVLEDGSEVVALEVHFNGEEQPRHVALVPDDVHGILDMVMTEIGRPDDA